MLSPYPLVPSPTSSVLGQDWSRPCGNKIINQPQQKQDDGRTPISPRRRRLGALSGSQGTFGEGSFISGGKFYQWMCSLQSQGWMSSADVLYVVFRSGRCSYPYVEVGVSAVSDRFRSLTPHCARDMLYMIGSALPLSRVPQTSCLFFWGG